MKNIFDRINDGHGHNIVEGGVFLKRVASPEIRAKHDALYHNIKRHTHKMTIFTVVFEAIMLIAWLGSDALGLPSELTVTFGLSFLVGVWVIIIIPDRFLYHQRIFKTRLRPLIEEAKKDIGIPEDAEKMEWIFPEKIEDAGWINGNHKGYLCDNFPLYTFVENSMLCLAQENGIFCLEIPLTSLHSISERTQKGRIRTWIQPRSVNHRHYRKHKVKCYSGGKYIIQFYTVQIRDPLGNFEICIPNYEVERFCEMTKLKLYNEFI